MAFILKDRVGEQIHAEGTGALTLTGVAMSGHQSIVSALADGSTSTFCVRDAQGVWQTFLGTYTAAPKSLARTAILDGTNGPGEAVSLSGSCVVWLVQSASNDWGAVNVKAFGAVGDGVTDDTDAFQRAAAAGLRLFVPPGDYVITEAIRLRSYAQVAGAGWASRIVIGTNFVNPGVAGNNDIGGYCVFCNENYELPALTDSDIIIRDLYFDDSLNPSHGAFHTLRFRMAERIFVTGCRFTYGGDAVAFRAVKNSAIDNNFGELCTNCFWDCWEECENIRVTNNYSHGDNANQHINFNAIRDGAQTNMSAAGFVCEGNICIDDTGSSCQFEPLSSSATNTVSNITVVNNVFTNVAIAARGAVSSVLISNNRFYSTNTGSAISIYTLGGDPTDFLITDNMFNWPNGTSAFGVVRCEAEDSVVSDNTFNGPTASYPAIYSGSVLGLVVDGNRASNGTISTPRSVAQSTEWHMPNGVRWGSYDNAGNRVDMRIQSGDNNLIFDGTDSVGGVRNIFSMVQRSDTSILIQSPPVELGAEEDNYLRVVGNSASDGPSISAQGADTDIPIRISSAGASPVVFTNTAGLRLVSGTGVRWLSGSGTPEGAVTAPVGSLYSRTDGGAGTSFYVKESGTGNTGWVAK